MLWIDSLGDHLFDSKGFVSSFVHVCIVIYFEEAVREILSLWCRETANWFVFGVFTAASHINILCTS